MTVKIITDSAADLPKETAAQRGIDVVPLLVYLGETEYQDNVTLQPEDLFRGMREGNVYKTSQPLYGSFESAFRAAADEPDGAVYVAFSSALSGTHQTSLLARDALESELPNLKLSVVDSKCASAGLGLVALKAAELAATGASREQVARAAERWARHMEHLFTVDDLAYLVRGGRVSPVAAFIGGLLNIKPLLHVEDGKLVPLEKVRGRKKVFERMLDLMEERGANLAGQTIAISHGDDPEAAELLRSMIEARFGCSKFLVTPIGAAVGAHAGPGTIALFFLNADESELSE